MKSRTFNVEDLRPVSLSELSDRELANHMKILATMTGPDAERATRRAQEELNRRSN